MNTVTDSNVPSAAGFTNKNSDNSLVTVVGIALTGVAMLGPVSANEVDPLFPAVYEYVTSSNLTSAEEMFDVCLGHPSTQDVYHYHAFVPCALNKSVAAAEACLNNAICDADPILYGEEAYTSYKSLNPIGIAKDGHIIWGMYNSNGALWGDCDVDVCNGATIDGYYGYAATSFHPYIVGCWGPGNYPTVS